MRDQGRNGRGPRPPMKDRARDHRDSRDFSKYDRPAHKQSGFQQYSPRAYQNPESGRQVDGYYSDDASQERKRQYGEAA